MARATSASATTQRARASSSWAPKPRAARRRSSRARGCSPSWAMAMPRRASAGGSSRRRDALEGAERVAGGEGARRGGDQGVHRDRLLRGAWPHPQPVIRRRRRTASRPAAAPRSTRFRKAGTGRGHVWRSSRAAELLPTSNRPGRPYSSQDADPGSACRGRCGRPRLAGPNKILKRRATMPMITQPPRFALMAGACAAALLVQPAAQASSHREAPFITTQPKVDGTDFYMFRSYENGREQLRDADRQLHSAAGPLRRPQLLRDGSQRAVRNPRRQQRRRGGGHQLPVPLQEQSAGHRAAGRRQERLDPADRRRAASVRRRATPPECEGDLHARRRAAAIDGRGDRAAVTNATGGGREFTKPVDNIGTKTLVRSPDTRPMRRSTSTRSTSPAAAGRAGCSSASARIRSSSTSASTFDLINLNPLGHPAASTDDLADKNVTTLALEVPAPA